MKYLIAFMLLLPTIVVTIILAMKLWSGDWMPDLENIKTNEKEKAQET